MFCGNCGAQVEDGVKFCPQCGAKIEEVGNSAPAAQATQMGTSASAAVSAKSAPASEKNLWVCFIDAVKMFWLCFVRGSKEQRSAYWGGRARRKEFWSFTLFGSLASIVASMLSKIPVLGWLIGFVFSIVFTVMDFIFTARRMHDVGKAAGFMFIPVYSLILAISDSQSGTNKYGQNPKGA